MKRLWTAAAFAASLALTACSDRTEENAGATATAAGSDLEAGTAQVGQAAGDAAAEVGAARDQTGDAIAGAATEAGQEAEEADRDAQH